jgi:hypothetical protein
MLPSLVHALQVDASTQRVLHGKSESGFGNQPSRFIPQIVLAKAVQEGNVTLSTFVKRCQMVGDSPPCCSRRVRYNIEKPFKTDTIAAARKNQKRTVL